MDEKELVASNLCSKQLKHIKGVREALDLSQISKELDQGQHKKDLQVQTRKILLKEVVKDLLLMLWA